LSAISLAHIINTENGNKLERLPALVPPMLASEAYIADIL